MGRGPPRTFSRGDGVSENRPARSKTTSTPHACTRPTRRISGSQEKYLKSVMSPSSKERKENIEMVPKAGHSKFYIHRISSGFGRSEFALLWVNDMIRSSLPCHFTIISLQNILVVRVPECR